MPPQATLENVFNNLNSRLEQQEALNRTLMAQLQQGQHTAASPQPFAAHSPAAPATVADLTASIGLAFATASSLPAIPTFDGVGDTSGLAAHAWIKQFELILDARSKLGIPTPEEQVVALARIAMRAHALSWLTSLPSYPTTWAAFKSALLERFQPASAQRIIEARLDALVEAAIKIRDRLNSQGVQLYTHRFVQLANQIPSTDMLDRTKITSYAKGLPSRLREFIIQQDERARSGATPLTLQLVIDLVGRRAASRELALDHTYGGHSAKPSDAMDLSSVDLCSRVFGLSVAEAQTYLDPAEGWAPHDTNDTPGASSSTGVDPQLLAMQQQLNALMSRRSLSPPVKKDVSDQLVNARRAAGLCIKCGVVKYEPGGKGHNSRTCKAPMDTSTSAEEGTRRAGLKPNF